MHECYDDIRDLSPNEPRWFDEHAVPRFCEFHPRRCANVYAQEAALVLIQCQRCNHQFHVAVTSDYFGQSVREQIRNHSIGWGDPPNIGCCPAGPTMSSDTLGVLQFWHRHGEDHVWRRACELEGLHPHKADA